LGAQSLAPKRAGLLKERDMLKRKTDKPRGVLNSRRLLPNVWHARYEPSADLAGFVEHYWTVEWDLTEAQVVETLPHPSMHIVLEPGLAQLAGVGSAKFRRTLEGKSRVFGVKFLPGGFHAFAVQPAASFSDEVFALADVLGPGARNLDQRVLEHANHQAAIGAAESFLRSLHPAADEIAELCARVVERIARDRGVIKVDQVGSLFGIGVRRLQRMFGEYVGVSPKWVIQRYRLHEAAERIAASHQPSWADIALDLGYADQSHFIRDFKRLVGVSPAEYLRSLGP
jgi:AraC-like DNA-binding protein